jgi:hypothetical protein
VSDSASPRGWFGEPLEPGLRRAGEPPAYTFFGADRVLLYRSGRFLELRPRAGATLPPAGPPPRTSAR